MNSPAAPAAHLAGDAASAIATAVERAYPNEACGLLIGRSDEAGWHITRAVVGSNVHPEPKRRFEVDPRLVFEWMRKLRGGAESVVGHFHSHPDGPAAPSETDRASAFDRSALWVIAAVPKGRMEAVRAFRLERDGAGFAEVPVKVE
jgi:proteasome lid subunit RPN8/RPN11